MAKLQKGISDAEADATKRAVAGKAAAKQLAKLKKDMAKQGGASGAFAGEGWIKRGRAATGAVRRWPSQGLT